ncbi:hypothetical protein [Symbioplanes lichenis]|uniref:hypothetical protein n=1 Tax=Symbioplanes lichenis TaxID=1629072 RepID=UPI00273A243F|nr:hypothetical protein [Actinoplanes lichenis]
MSRQVRHRTTGLLLGGFLLGAAVVTTGTASAGQIEATGRQVVFGNGGGMLGLSCESTPSIESMTVPAESTVRVINRTGYGAELMLNGSSKGTVPENGATEVVFRRGTTAVMLDPNCAVSDPATPVMVTASPSASGPALPDPEPTDDDAGELPTTPPKSDTPTTSAVPAGGAPTARPQRPGRARPAAPRPAGRESASTRHAVPALPLGGVAQPGAVKPRTRTIPGTATAGAPVITQLPDGMPGLSPGVDQPELVDVQETGVPVTTEAAPAAAAAPVHEVAAAEPVAAVRPMRESRPNGLLGVVAAVFVVGVGAAAIRAFVSQRASRANVA